MPPKLMTTPSWFSLPQSYHKRRRALDAAAAAAANEDDSVAKRAKLAVEDEVVEEVRSGTVTPLPPANEIVAVPAEAATPPPADASGSNSDGVEIVKKKKKAKVELVPVPIDAVCAECGHSARQRYEQRGNGAYCGLLHTLFAYQQLYVELFALYERRQAEPRSRNAVHEALAALLERYDISMRARPVAFYVPFETGLKPNSEIVFNGWICPSVRRALTIAAQLILGNRRALDAAVNRFTQNVLLPSLIYLHDALHRRAKEPLKKKREGTLKLSHAQDELTVHPDKLFTFIATCGVRSAERDCAAFAQLQREQLAIAERNAGAGRYLLGELPSATMHALQTVLRAVTDGAYSTQYAEAELCGALRRGGRSGVDYLMPGRTGVATLPSHAIEFGVDRVLHFVENTPAPLIDASTAEQLVATAHLGDEKLEAELELLLRPSGARTLAHSTDTPASSTTTSSSSSPSPSQSSATKPPPPPLQPLMELLRGK